METLPHIRLIMNGKPLKFLIDSGSTLNMINPNIFNKKDRIPIVHKIISANAVSYAYGKYVTNLHGISEESFELIEYPFSTYFHGLIGVQLLRQLNARIDFSNNTIILNNIKFTLSPISPLITQNNQTDETISNEIEDYDTHATNAITNIDLNDSEPIQVCHTSMKEQLFRLDHLNSEEKSHLTKALKEYDDIFYRENDNLTFTNQVKHKIRTRHENPIYTKSYRYPFKYKNEVDKQINEMLEQGIIRNSNSPYSAPIWIVPKKMDASGNQKFRLVVDYRKLNEITIADKFPIPNIDDILDKLGHAKYFTTLDLAKGFHQIEINHDDIPKTAFSTSSGHYEWLRMPFGLCNAPATFQRLMNTILAKYVGKICFVYLDDIIIFSSSLQEHIDSLRKIFKTLRDANLKVQLDKCEFLKHETEYLGHIISDKGVQPNPKKIEAVKMFPIPKTQHQIRQFLGLVGYYRKFIKSFSEIAKPLTNKLKLKAKVNINDPEYANAFKKLKTLLISHPILAYPNFNKEFVLTTDASNYAIGAVLSQDGHPICYASRTLNEHEINYATFEKELLAIVWGVGQNRVYLYGVRFTIQTDQRAISFLHNTKNENSRVLRWKIRLSEYDYKIEYLAGKENKVADALSRPIMEGDLSLATTENNSRKPQNKDRFVAYTQSSPIRERNSFLATNDRVNIINTGHKKTNLEIKCRPQNSTPEITSLENRHLINLDTDNSTSVTPIYTTMTDEYSRLINNMTGVNQLNDPVDPMDIESDNSSIAVEPSDGTQHSAEEDASNLIPITERPINVFDNQFYFKIGNDESIKKFKRQKKNVIVFKTKQFTTEYFHKMITEHFPCSGTIAVHFENIKDFHAFQLEYQRSKDPSSPVKIFKANYELRVVNNLAELQEIILKEHQKTNHRGIHTLYQTLKYTIYWPNLQKELTKVINNCSICNLAKYDRKPLKLPFKETDSPSGCREMYQIDLWQLNTKDYYLTCIDVYSKYAQVVKLTGRTWLDAKNALITIFNNSGKPVNIKADLDPCLKSANLFDWLKTENINLIHTSSKTGIADIERFHGSLNEHIRILNNRDDVDGLDLVTTALYYYNTTYHSTIENIPQFVHFNTIDVSEILAKNKKKRIDRANKERREEEINEQLIHRPRVRKLDNPKRKLNKIRRIDEDHYEETRRNNVKNVLYKSNFAKKKKYTN